MEEVQHFKGGLEGESHTVGIRSGPTSSRRRSGGKGETDGRILEILGITGMTIRETGEPGKAARFEIWIPPAGFREKEGPGDARAEAAGVRMPPGLLPGIGRATT
ncbi:MAG TPA: hypothetical protein VMT31_04720 [Methanomicrobiales archaeon]|jgi:hypothetical protein|nr:hypothetical protein [Methanomicrobiales archaeon]